MCRCDITASQVQGDCLKFDEASHVSQVSLWDTSRSDLHTKGNSVSSAVTGRLVVGNAEKLMVYRRHLTDYFQTVNPSSHSDFVDRAHPADPYSHINAASPICSVHPSLSEQIFAQPRLLLSNAIQGLEVSPTIFFHLIDQLGKPRLNPLRWRFS